MESRVQIRDENISPNSPAQLISRQYAVFLCGLEHRNSAMLSSQLENQRRLGGDRAPANESALLSCAENLQFSRFSENASTAFCLQRPE